MQFIRYRFGDQVKWGRVEGDSVVELSASPWTEDLQEGRRFTPDPDLPHLPPCEPTKIVCVGKNYSAHIQELHPGEDIPKEPLLFLKPPSALLHPGGTILIPPQSERVDYEGEVAVVMGRKLSWGTGEEVRRAIFGYTLANDVTARDLQRKDVQFTRGKGFDTFCPVGPLLCKNLPEGAKLVTEVNGEVRQKAPLTQMIFSPEEVVGYISRIMTLLPGDIILTGTPEGVGPLKPGDVVEVELQGLGILHNSVKAREAS